MQVLSPPHPSVTILYTYCSFITKIFHEKTLTSKQIGKRYLTTQLAEPLTAKKKFVDSLTYYKKYLGDTRDSSPEIQAEESINVRPTFTVKRVRPAPHVRKLKPKIQKRMIVSLEAQEVEAEVEETSEVQMVERSRDRPTFTVKRVQSLSRVRKITPKIRTRKKTLVFSVQEVVAEAEASFEPEVVAEAEASFEPEVVAEAEASFEPEVVAEAEITPEKLVTIDVDKLSEDDFYKILGFLESERRKLEGVKTTSASSWIKHSRKRVY
jgi:hypothetical protein